MVKNLLKLAQIQLLSILLLLVATPTNADGKAAIYLYTYHNKPPFIVDLSKQTGLYFDLANYLTERSSKYKFETIYLPRKRLDHMIENSQLDGVVLGVSPVWFKDKEEEKFLWLPGYYRDRDDFISLKSAPFEYRGKESLLGTTIASVAGYYYFNINEIVAEGKMLRIDTIGEVQVLQLIQKQRADMGLVSHSLFKYLEKQGDQKDIYHVSSNPHDSFERRAFTTVDNNDVYLDIKSLFAQMYTDVDWQIIVSKYE